MLARSASNDVSVRERKIFPGGRATGVRGLRDLVTVPPAPGAFSGQRQGWYG